MKEESAVNEYMGCMIKRVNSEVYLYQTDLIKKLEEKFGEELSNVRECNFMDDYGIFGTTGRISNKGIL